jgi:hypothetical protein
VFSGVADIKTRKWYSAFLRPFKKVRKSFGLWDTGSMDGQDIMVDGGSACFASLLNSLQDFCQDISSSFRGVVYFLFLPFSAVSHYPGFRLKDISVRVFDSTLFDYAVCGNTTRDGLSLTAIRLSQSDSLS